MYTIYLNLDFLFEFCLTTQKFLRPLEIISAPFCAYRTFFFEQVGFLILGLRPSSLIKGSESVFLKRLGH